MKVDKVPEQDPTLPQVARGVNQVHACLEAERKTAGRHRTALRKEMKAQRDEIERLSTALIGAADAPKKSPPKLGAMTAWQAGWRIALSTGTGLGAVVIIYRALYALWPAAQAFLKALNQVVLHGHL